MIKINLIKTICLLLLLFTSFAIYADTTAAAATATPAVSNGTQNSQPQTSPQSKNPIYQCLFGALQDYNNDFLYEWLARLVTKGAVLLKNAFESLVDNVFDMLCKSLLRLWDITQSVSITEYSNIKTSVDPQTGISTPQEVKSTVDIGVGSATVKYITEIVMPFLYTLVGVFLYIFVVLKLVSGLFKNESPFQMVGYFMIVVFLIIGYNVLYSATIQLFSHILGYMGNETASIKTSELGNNFAVTLTNDPTTLNLIASSHDLTFADIDSIYANPSSITHLWVGIVVELVVASMFIYFIIQILLLKGQQLVQLFLSYFLGILILPITLISGYDLFVRWIKSFVGTCLYSFVWGLLFMLLYAISLIKLGGLSSAAGLPSILQLVMYFGTFMLMTQVGKLTEFFTGGDNFGKIAQSSTREFGAMMRSAGQAAVLPAAVVTGAAAFAGGTVAGLLPEQAKNPMSGITGGSGSGGGSSSGGSGFSRGGSGFKKASNPISQAINGVQQHMAGSFNAGQSFGSGAADILKELRKSKVNAPPPPPNDGTTTNMPENFVG
jgi:hypothetical protein